MTRFLVVVPTHRLHLSRNTIADLQASLTYPTEFHVLDGTLSKVHALNKALVDLVNITRHDIYCTVDDDILPGENWQHFMACAFDRVRNLGACGVDYTGTVEGESVMQNAMRAPVEQVRDIRFRDCTGYQNVAGGCMAMRPKVAKQIGPYPFADDGRQYHADEDGWRSHQVTTRGMRVGYVVNPNGPVKLIVYDDSPEYLSKKAVDIATWRGNPVW